MDDMARKQAFNYFDNFIEYADLAVKAAEHLNQTLTHFDTATFNQRMDELHKIEHDADEINHRTMDHLAKEFLPPIEREDLVALSHEMDDVVDCIDDIMRRMCMYGIKSVKPEAVEFCGLIVRCCHALRDLACEFKHFKKSSTIKNFLVKVNSLETEGDTMHFNAVNKLFAQPESPLDAIVWKDIFDDFELCCDNCEHVGQVIQGVVLKNS
jgi:predicted phosphate transport protein (TIGR00153 family)